jgi:SAM-dependent MidA family methyltransferase
LNQLAEKIREEIRIHGPISFTRFMACALYCPVYGYYEKEEDTLGRHGDYYTSVSVGSLFGELLGFQFSDWLTGLQPSSAGPPVVIVESGAHHGDLARDILTWLRAHRPVLSQVIEYWIVEPSIRRQEWQRRTLADFQSQVRWAKSLKELSEADGPRRHSCTRGVRGVIFCNELLDALPVQRVGWDSASSTWFEWGVTFSNGRFAWTRLEELSSVSQSNPETTDFSNSHDASALAPIAWPPNFLNALPDGFTMDLCPAASDWWAQATGVLECGKLLAIDYGLTSDELVSPERIHGTLRAYRKHRLSPDVLQDPGEQDITAHINFSTLRELGELGGLQTELCSTQERFLAPIAAKMLGDLTETGGWLSERSRQFQTLTHPNHLGHSFRVLLQGR